MRYIRYGFLAALAVVLISVAMANRGAVELRLLPEVLAQPLGLSWSIELPLFVVIFAAIVAGLLIGFVWEWLREHKHRAEAARKKGEVNQLKREVTRLKGDAAKGGEGSEDEVLALLDKAS
ncbi:LapA family protein [Alisedimentitalea sp. MJ-SS2]|uniref:LapA family protein n=1 Tax=Aliisedimentitalea sp. MJ-SS2 TaxID=3049795 RepID=UPI0029067A9A|nr:LapA family protein [Alisedimentitalea sp. MJ-SS2]MDU8926013.1 LapA family protein [Alisedimentitalea sp. MJ-SS2]